MRAGCGAWGAGLAGGGSLPAAAVLAALLAGLLGGNGCSGREHENPFDPLNPATGGEPEALHAAAGCGQVALAWDGFGMNDLEGIRLWRRAPGEAESLLTASPLEAGVCSYDDHGANNGVTYRYRVEYLFGTESAWSAPREARADRGLPWVADPCGGGLQLLTADAGATRARTAEGNLIYDVAIDLAGERLFAAALAYPSRVLVLDHEGAGPLEEWEVSGASALSWSEEGQTLAVAAFYESQVSWLSATGEPLETWSFSGPVRYPEDLACRDAHCTWVALSDSSGQDGALLRIDWVEARSETLAVALVRPVAVVDDRGAGGCWVADRGGQVLFVDDQLGWVASAPGIFEEPVDLDCDGQGACWVADRRRQALVRIDRSGEVLATLSDRGAVHGVTWDPVGGRLWVTLPLEGVVLCLDGRDALGETLGRGVVGGCPVKVAGDWEACVP